MKTEGNFFNDVIALYNGKLVLVNRLTEPKGLALPGGKEDRTSEFRINAIREFKEETGLDLLLYGWTETRDNYTNPNGSLKEYFLGSKHPEEIYHFTVHFGKAIGTPCDEQGKTQVVLLNLGDIDSVKDKFAYEDHYKALKSFIDGGFRCRFYYFGFRPSGTWTSRWSNR